MHNLDPNDLAIGLADRYLSTSQDDSDQPATEEWIYANKPDGVSVATSRPFVHGETQYAVSVEKTATYCGPVTSRGHFRDILRAMRIPPNEVPDAN